MPAPPQIPGFRPPQWGRNAPPLTIIVPGQSGTSSPGVAGPVTLPGYATMMYVFDGIIRAEHQQRLQITQIPVQTQASISDHSYLLPATVTVEIAMSDAMQSYTLGQFSGASSRSVSAYQTLLALQSGQRFLQLATRLNQYSNMLIADISADDTQNTAYGLKAMVTFQQVLQANVEITNSTIVFGDSARDQATGSSPSGASQGTQPSQSITQQHSAIGLPTDSSSPIAAGLSVPPTYAGGWGSTNINVPV